MRRLICLSVLNHSAFAGSRVVMSLAGLQLQASPFAIGLILSFYGLLPMVLSVVAGRWVDRVGMRLPMLVGTALVILASVCRSSPGTSARCTWPVSPSDWVSCGSTCVCRRRPASWDARKTAR